MIEKVGECIGGRKRYAAVARPTALIISVIFENFVKP